MDEARFALDWQLEITDEEAGRLAEALAPETDEHAELDTVDGRLRVSGEGTAGESLHTLDDVLACLTAALESLDAVDEGA